MGRRKPAAITVWTASLPSLHSAVAAFRMDGSSTVQSSSCHPLNLDYMNEEGSLELTFLFHIFFLFGYRLFIR